MKKNITNLIAYIKSLPTQKKLVLLTLLVIAAVIPLNVLLSQRQLQFNPFAEEEGIDRTEPKVNIPLNAAKKNFERLTKRTTLSEEDLTVRKRLIEDLRTKMNIPAPEPIEGTIYQDETIRIDYVSIPDDFEAEILSQNINQAKAQAENWLRKQGLSNNGICNLPLTFYLGPTILDSLPGNISFDPNPLGCQ